MSQFYALMSDDSVKLISLTENIVAEIKAIFLSGGEKLKPDGIEEDVFDGDIACRQGENITYVNFVLPPDFLRIPDNQADISEFNISEDIPKSIFYYDNGKFYFQIFNKKNLLQRKMVLKYEVGNAFTKLSEDAFIVDNKVQAIYENGRLYFQSYTAANQIFSLMEFVTEATNSEIESFGNIDGISIDTQHLKQMANTKTRRLIKLVSNSENVGIFMRKAGRTKTTLLRKYVVQIRINDNNELEFPTNNVADLNRALEFFNEDIFRGVITDKLWRSNSKKKDDA